MLNKNHGDRFSKKTKEKLLRKKIVLPLILIFIFAFGGVAGAAVTFLAFNGRDITNEEVKPVIDKLKTKIDAYEVNEQAHIDAYDELYAQSVSRIQDARSIISDLRKDIDTLNADKLDLEKKKDDLEVKVSKTEDELRNKEKEVNELKVSIADKESQLATKTNELNKAVEKAIKLENDLASLKESSENLNNDLIDEVKAANEEVEKTRQLLKEVNTYIAELNGPTYPSKKELEEVDNNNETDKDNPNKGPGNNSGNGNEHPNGVGPKN